MFVEVLTKPGERGRLLYEASLKVVAKSFTKEGIL
jgi:hypothetical protein